MYSLGIDLGSSSIKLALIQSKDGAYIDSAQYPEKEMTIISEREGFAEQDPDQWWNVFEKCIATLKEKHSEKLLKVEAIGIAYQMHGLVAVDENNEPIRSSIIWCDSRAVEIGQNAFKELGENYCLNNLLNSPGNFTASKLKWVKQNEPDKYENIAKIMLPGDFIAMKLTGTINTSITGLSEGIFWDFNSGSVSQKVLDNYEIDSSLIPDYQESFSTFSKLDKKIAKELGLNPEAMITYKAGDQPNNALSLNVMEAGEIAATAGTSGVVYGVTDELFVDEKQRVNSFAHVNYSKSKPKIGVLLCINGVGIANAWIKRVGNYQSYEEINDAIEDLKSGAEGLLFFPFGNGAERMLSNKNPGGGLYGLNFNIHGRAHLARAVQEGIIFSFILGLETFKEKGIELKTIKAGKANMFQSTFFAQSIADLSRAEIQLYNTDGAVGAARGALIGAGLLTREAAFQELIKLTSYYPTNNKILQEHYINWKQILNSKILN